MVAVLDSRIFSKSYGSTFLRAIPECTVRHGQVADLGSAAEEWLRRSVRRGRLTKLVRIAQTFLRDGVYMSDVIDRNLALELARVTESAAFASAAWMGKGQKEDADQAAVDAMRYFLGSVEMDGIVVIGEGAKDEAPMLFVGEQVGTGEQPKVDIAVDPIDGTRLLANGMPNACRSWRFLIRHDVHCADIAYMQKIAVGPEAADVIDIDLSPARTSHAFRAR